MTTNNAAELARVRQMTASGEAQQLRTSAHLSLADVALQCNVNQSTIWRWETGEHRPHGKAALRYAALLDLLKGIGSR